MTQDGVQLGGFLIHPTNRNALSNVTLVYLHGISFDPKQKVPEMMEYANEINSQIVLFNYRGYSYSE